MAGEVTQLQPGMVSGYYVIPDKVPAGFVTKSAGDTLTLTLTEGATSFDTAVYDFPRLILTEVATVLVIPDIRQDTLTLILTDVAQLVQFGPPLDKVAADTLTLTLTESRSIAVDITGVDTLTLHISDVLSGPLIVAPIAVDVADTLTLTLTDAASIAVTITAVDQLTLVIDDQAEEPFPIGPIDIVGTDTLTLTLTESAADVSVTIDASDSLRLQILDETVGNLPIDITPTIIDVSDTLTLTITDAFLTIIPILPFEARDVEDELRLLLADSATVVSLGGDVDRIDISMRAFWRIQVSFD